MNNYCPGDKLCCPSCFFIFRICTSNFGGKIYSNGSEWKEMGSYCGCFVKEGAITLKLVRGTSLSQVLYGSGSGSEADG